MKASDLLRWSPAHWILIAVTVICALVAITLVGKGLGFRWDPLNSAGRKVAAAESAATTAISDSAARSVEAAGAADTTGRVEAVARQTRQADYAAATINPAAKAAPDAQSRLDPDRVARLRGVDDQLCAISPRVCAAGSDPAAPPRDAGDRPAAVPAAAPAG